MVEDPAAACPQAQWIWIHSYASAMAKLLRLAFQAQSRSVWRFDHQFGSRQAGVRSTSRSQKAEMRSYFLTRIQVNPANPMINIPLTAHALLPDAPGKKCIAAAPIAGPAQLPAPIAAS